MLNFGVVTMVINHLLVLGWSSKWEASSPRLSGLLVAWEADFDLRESSDTWGKGVTKKGSSLGAFGVYKMSIGVVLLMEEMPNNHLGCFWNLVNHGINYLSLNWSAGFLNHQQYVTKLIQIVLLFVYDWDLQNRIQDGCFRCISKDVESPWQGLDQICGQRNVDLWNQSSGEN